MPIDNAITSPAGAPAHVAIVGSGFSGVATAWQLMALLPASSTVTIFNGSGQFARGLAYGTRSARHVLNVPAARMGICPDQPTSFVEWLQQSTTDGETWHGHEFAPRWRYGDYLEAALRAQAGRHPDVTLRHEVAIVERCEPQAGRWALITRGAPPLARAPFDAVVLALGHFAPRPPVAGLESMGASRYVNDPWSDKHWQDLEPNAPVALIGTGLTMLDALHSLQGAGHRGPILALSRRGLVPLGHRALEHRSQPWEPGPELAEAAGLRARLHWLREAVERAAAEGHDWRDVMAALRPHTPGLWKGLSIDERARFLRHAATYWDVHRHRAAPQALRTMTSMIEAGRLTVSAGRIAGLTPGEAHIDLHWRLRGSTALRTFQAARIINCTGPTSRITAQSSPLLWSLAEEGRLAPCPLGLGLHVDDEHQVLDASGRGQRGLYYIGPLLKAQSWEATAVPELREHAKHLAASVSARLAPAVA